MSTGRDIHKETAAEMFGVPVDQVTPQQRQAAKSRNFLDLYSSRDKIAPPAKKS